MWYAQIVGYGFPVILGVLLIRNVVDRLWDCLAPDGSRNPRIRLEPWQPQALAFLEAILYVAFLQIGQGWFIGLWLGLKMAGHWTRWSEGADEPTQKPAGQSVFNIFLMGNALAVVYSFVGFKLIGWISAGRLLRASWVSVLVIVLTLVFWFWLGRFQKPSSAPSSPSPH